MAHNKVMAAAVSVMISQYRGSGNVVSPAVFNPLTTTRKITA